MRRDCTSKYNRRLVIHLLALLGILSISFSAIFVRLAAVSPVTATFYRGAYAAPVLLAIWLAQQSQDRRGPRGRPPPPGPRPFARGPLLHLHRALPPSGRWRGPGCVATAV